MMKSSAILLFFMTTIMISSCNNAIIYEEKIDLKNSLFSKNVEINYSFEISDTLSKYDVILEVNHSEEYSYQNLYVKIKTIFPGSKSIEDILSLELSKSGTEWQGKCSGDNCTAPIVLVENTKFQSPGKYQISISQYGRTEEVEGLNSFKLMVKKVVAE